MTDPYLDSGGAFDETGGRASRQSATRLRRERRHLMDEKKRKEPTPAEPTPREGEEPEPKPEPKPEGDLDS